MKLSDWVAEFLVRRGIRHAFVVTGGASLHMIDSIARNPGIDYVCPAHEQAGAMAADAYARISGTPGCAIATSGPGATNLLTGVICSWFDSVPVLYLTGQVTTFRLKGDTGVRQMGFQETDIVEMCRPVTKSAVMVRDWRMIGVELERAFATAVSGRPGPVLVDIPDDLQRMDIDPDELVPYTPEAATPRPAPDPASVDAIAVALAAAERPVAILGWGIRLAGAEAEARELVERLGLPALLTWPAGDMIPSDHPCVVGAFGTHGTRHANFALQNADLVLSVGARLDTREAGTPYSDFARAATKHVVDIDPTELNKLPVFGMEVDTMVHADARVFFQHLLDRTEGSKPLAIDAWRTQIEVWRERYPVCPASFREEEAVNPYVFVDELSDACDPGETLVLDTGCALAWTCQGFRFKEGQRLIHAFNTTAMGYGLPGAVGASFALGGAPVTCITGDGSLMMNIQELATVAHHRLPVKIFLIDNGGYAMVQQTQEQWLDGRYAATTPETGLGFPDWARAAAAFGLETMEITRNDEIADVIRRVREADGPVFCRVEISASHRVIPQVRFGYPIEDGEPFLAREEFLANMIVEPTPASLGGALPSVVTDTIAS
ncbi:MAG TPA: thiamine pyrophosphate-binding protein [Plantibacter sp.]|uniref:thiamine pyrophosphate-binding protein n=1 Tax=Plantibacter sp. TaxID=1871045 RepID=UPI002C504A1C|nr:thiamine pyrophosphate-binding protein [Plantibacter sp.]